MSERKLNLVALLILLVGLCQMTGDLLRIPTLKGLAAATMISPAPKVFTAHQGHETYSVKFIVAWTDREGKQHQLHVTPEVYGKVEGPYQRRNVYGAVLSYGPVMFTDPKARPMYDAVSQYALCGEAPLLREIGIDPQDVVGPIKVIYVPPPAVDMGSLPRELEVPCKH